MGQSKGEIRENDRCSPETLFNCREYSMSAGGCSLTGFMYVCVCVCVSVGEGEGDFRVCLSSKLFL